MSGAALDLALDETQQAVADSVSKLCRDHCAEDAPGAGAAGFPAGPWKALAELGVLSLATPEGEGGAVEMVAALESLGRAVFPGPLAETFLATQLLPEDLRRAVGSGECIVSVGTPPLMPFAPVARVFVELAGERAFLARPAGPVESVATLGGEPWGRVRLEREAELPGAEGALALHATALASYLAAAGRRLVDDTAAYARTRRQFGRAIGEFQAVAHPLAECAIGLDGVAVLARAAAAETPAPRRVRAAAARLGARRAALAAVHTCHQLFGAVGITLEGPVFRVSRRILQRAEGSVGEAWARRVLLEAFGVPPAHGSEA